MKTAKWHNSFILVLKPSGKIRLCLEPARLNQALNGPVHRGQTFNDIVMEWTFLINQMLNIT